MQLAGMALLHLATHGSVGRRNSDSVGAENSSTLCDLGIFDARIDIKWSG